MDMHRCRFVPYPPSAINAIAFSHPQEPRSRKGQCRLAIGRASGDIEIWNPLEGLWHQESVLHGGRDRSIDGLVWAQEPDSDVGSGKSGKEMFGRSRLFSIGYTSTVTEWDLAAGRPKTQARGSHGDIWCLAVQPFVTLNKAKVRVVHSVQRLVAGTMDGSLALYSIAGGELAFDKVLVKATTRGAKMVSIAFQNRNRAIVGCSDGCIRVYDMRGGSLVSKMTVGAHLTGPGPRHKDKEIIVWSVKCLNGRDIVSGDSTGQVCIWDGKTYTQAQRLQSHKQDVLSLTTSADGTTIMSGGMDKRTCLYRQTRGESGSGSGSRWSEVWHRRYHGHDVKTMAAFESPSMSVVVSGGPDANPVVIPLREAGMENHRSLSKLPQVPPLASAPKARLMVGWWERELHIWRIRQPLKDLILLANHSDINISQNRKLLARILIQGEANITSAAISSDGRLLFISTASDVKAFHLQLSATSEDVRICKVDIPCATSVLMNGATRLAFSPDGHWLCAIQKNSLITLIRVLYEREKPVALSKTISLTRLDRGIPKHISMGGWADYERGISHVSFSADSRLLAVADRSGFIDMWMANEATGFSANRGAKLNAPSSGSRSGSNSDSDGDSGSESDDESEARNTCAGISWTRNPNASKIPRLQSAPTILCFSDYIPYLSPPILPNNHRLLVIGAKPEILLFDALQGTMTDWTRRNHLLKYPVDFRNIRDLAKGALWAGDRIWLYGNSFIAMFDTSQDLPVIQPSSDLVPAGSDQTGRKRKRARGTGAGNKMAIGAAGPRKIEKCFDDGDAMELDLEAHRGSDDDNDDNDEESEEEEEEKEKGKQRELARRREAEARSTKGEDKSAQGAQGAPFWLTLKYRPILGIVPLEEEEDKKKQEELEKKDGEDEIVVVWGKEKKTIEVAIVERPEWDVDVDEAGV